MRRMRAWIPFIFFVSVVAVIVQAADVPPLSSQFATIEWEVGGRLGVAALDTGSGRRIEYRAGEKFPMCSTFKFLLAAAILQKGNQEPLDKRIAYGADDLLDWAPITRKHAAEKQMTVGELCAAAIDYSDNTAANLLLRELGGPAKLTEYIRGIGDPVTRLDRTEPALNSAIAGDPRDTTTPAAMVSDLKRLLLGDQLPKEGRDHLEAWLAANTTGSKRIRAGLPAGWIVGDKTGTGFNGTAGDIAIVRPPNHAPVLIAIYVTQSTGSDTKINLAIANAASFIAQQIGN